jgi:class 3 adenylate cyclase
MALKQEHQAEFRQRGRVMADTDKTAKSAGMSPVTAAIVFMDIVGSMKLITNIGDLAFAKIFQQYYTLVGSSAKTHNGIIVKSMGDAVLLIFRNVLDAIPFISGLCNSLLRDPSDDIKNIQLRISLHIGDVLMEPRSYGAEIFGSAVNIAVRLSTLARPNQLVVSHSSVDYLPPDQRALVRQTENSDLKGFDGRVEFGRIDLSELRVT